MPCRNVLPKPRQKPHPPMWIACTNRDTIKVAARNGLGALAFTFIDPDEAKAWADIYYDIIKSDECVPIGHTVNANIALVTGFSMHEDRADGDPPRPGGLRVLRLRDELARHAGPGAGSHQPVGRVPGAPRPVGRGRAHRDGRGRRRRVLELHRHARRRAPLPARPRRRRCRPADLHPAVRPQPARGHLLLARDVRRRGAPRVHGRRSRPPASARTTNWRRSSRPRSLASSGCSRSPTTTSRSFARRSPRPRPPVASPDPARHAAPTPADTTPTPRHRHEPTSGKPPRTVRRTRTTLSPTHAERRMTGREEIDQMTVSTPLPFRRAR